MCRPAITSELRLPVFWPMLTASLSLSSDRPLLTHADPLHGPWPGALPAASHTMVTSLYLSSSSLKGTLFPPPQTPFLIWSFKKKKKKQAVCFPLNRTTAHLSPGHWWLRAGSCGCRARDVGEGSLTLWRPPGQQVHG